MLLSCAYGSASLWTVTFGCRAGVLTYDLARMQLLLHDELSCVYRFLRVGEEIYPNTSCLFISQRQMRKKAAAEAQLKESQDRASHTASQCIAVCCSGWQELLVSCRERLREVVDQRVRTPRRKKLLSADQRGQRVYETPVAHSC